MSQFFERRATSTYAALQGRKYRKVIGSYPEFLGTADMA